VELTLNRIEKLARLVSPNPLRRRPSRHPQCSFDRIDYLRTYFYTRIEPAQLIVEISSRKQGMTKDASGHGHRDGTLLVVWKKSIHHDGANLREFPARIGQDLQGKCVFAGRNGRKERGEVGRGDGVGSAGKVGQRRHVPHSAQCCGEWPVKDVLRRSISLIAGAKNSANGGAADPMGGTFVADSESPASSTRGAGTSDASAGNLSGRDTSGSTCLPRRLQQRLASLDLSDANDIAWPGGCRRKQAGLIPHRTSGLRAAAVNAEIVRQGIFLTQPRCHRWLPISWSPRGPQSLTRGKTRLLP